ncbi:MAG TPA: hypothetical protein VD905_03075 [Flavobacteriales bacterium]|nr:hypothetical protein [Flavobacteriales bacterium]
MSRTHSTGWRKKVEAPEKDHAVNKSITSQFAGTGFGSPFDSSGKINIFSNFDERNNNSLLMKFSPVP